MTDPVRLELAGGVARITFNRPERMNALDAATGEAFERAVLQALAGEARVVLLRAEGESFMAGGDLSAFRGVDDRAAEVAKVIDPMHRALKALETSAAITVAAVQGAVAGAGMSIFLGADLGIAAEGATFNLAYARIGAVPDCGGSWALPRLVGLRRALELTLLSRTLTAGEALEMALATAVVPDEALEAEAAALAERLAAGPAFAQGRIKALLRGAVQRDYGEQLDAERAGFLEAAADPDFAEGVRAFFERRHPDYSRGRT